MDGLASAVCGGACESVSGCIGVGWGRASHSETSGTGLWCKTDIYMFREPTQLHIPSVGTTANITAKGDCSRCCAVLCKSE